MSRRQRNITLILFLMALFPTLAAGQGAGDVLRYSLEYPSYDANSMVLPGVTNASGFGSFQENPAVMGLFEESFTSFSFSFRNVNEETTFNSDVHSFDDNQSNVGDFGLVYRIPTIQGSFVLGGGYSQTSDFNRAMGIDLRNNESTLTDYYQEAGFSDSPYYNEDLYNAAFDVYAVDWADVDSTFTTSIFRIGFTPDEFPGVNQDMELTERGKMGEYSAFFATEFQQNLFLGASIGVLAGNYSYERQFLESDPDNIYDGTIIDSDSDGTGDTDIQSILSVDTIDAEFTAFSARLGVLFRVNPNLHIGGSYEFPSKLSFTEEYNTRLESTFDNGDGFEEALPGEFTYKIKRPARMNVGISIVDIGGLTLSAAAERVDYSSAELDLEGSDIEYQNEENDFIDQEYKEVYNLRAGLEFKINEAFVPRVGYAYHPSPRESFDATREFFNAGFSARMSETIWFDLGAQYSVWNDENRLYSYYNGSELVDEIASETVQRLHVMAGLRFDF